jgi:hypothetical protein
MEHTGSLGLHTDIPLCPTERHLSKATCQNCGQARHYIKTFLDVEAQIEDIQLRHQWTRNITVLSAHKGVPVKTRITLQNHWLIAWSLGFKRFWELALLPGDWLPMFQDIVLPSWANYPWKMKTWSFDTQESLTQWNSILSLKTCSLGDTNLAEAQFPHQVTI